MRPRKDTQVADRLAARIRKGDYHLHELPSERELAVEAGVSYTTARKAVQLLVERGLLRRQANGRASVTASATGSSHDCPAQVALLTPAWESPSIAGWRQALMAASSRRPASVRTVLYAHWDDPVITTTLQGFDGTFLVPEPDPPPKPLLRALREGIRPVVALDTDWSLHGIRSVLLNPGFVAHRLLDHLASLGHRKIDYLNVQPGGGLGRVPWQLWLTAQGMDGDCIDEPVQSYEDPLPAAYSLLDRRIHKGHFQSKALLCATEPAALGAMAALIDHGLRPGHDVAVCTLDSGARAAFANPSLTSMADVDRTPYVALCLDWMLGRSKAATTLPLLLQPDDARVVVRQSTVPNTPRHRRLT